MQAVARTAQVLWVLTHADRSLGVREIAVGANIPKSATHRILETLIEAGFVSHQPGEQGYRLAPTVAASGLRALGALRAVALPELSAVLDVTSETVLLSLRSGTEQVHVEQVRSPLGPRPAVPMGSRIPLYAGASGRAILASFAPADLDRFLCSVQLVKLTPRTITNVECLRHALDVVRQRGYAASVGEHNPVLAAVSSPLFDRRQVVGAITICGPTDRFAAAQVKQFGPLVREAAERVSGGLGPRVKRPWHQMPRLPIRSPAAAFGGR